MPNLTQKRPTELDANQTLQHSFNDSDKSLTTSSFITAKIGHKITRTIVDATTEDYRYLDVVITRNGTTTNLSPIITGLSQTIDLVVGQYVYGSGIPANAKILSIDSSSQITLDQNATASATVSLKFANLLYRFRVVYDNASHDNVDDTERLE